MGSISSRQRLDPTGLTISLKCKLLDFGECHVDQLIGVYVLDLSNVARLGEKRAV